ncbi:MAG: pirin family protein [Flavobacteriales bacterium]|tara:strand:- start:159 stop:1037 length:879 start_codon:yes stop_codon:yes gene_type:complete
MKRKEFIQKTLLAGVFGAVAPLFAYAKNEKVKKSTYDKLIDKVGFNHMPNEENKTANTVLHKANTRGSANHGWLEVNHTFSFANYHNSERMHFGVLRVFNDDKIAPSRGFSTHPHDNMEIITIPLEGDLKHKDNMGNGAIIKHGDVQVMSAGTGITHSEFNANNDKDVKVLQIWLFPNKRNVVPRYEQLSINSISSKNQLNQILSPSSKDQGVWIHQNAWFHLGEFDKKKSFTYELKDKNNGVYAFIIEGNATIENQALNKRDGFGIWNTDKIKITAENKSRILILEVPMTI